MSDAVNIVNRRRGGGGGGGGGKAPTSGSKARICSRAANSKVLLLPISLIWTPRP